MSTNQKTLRHTWHPLSNLNESACSDLIAGDDDSTCTHPIECAAVSSEEMVPASASASEAVQGQVLIVL